MPFNLTTNLSALGVCRSYHRQYAIATIGTERPANFDNALPLKMSGRVWLIPDINAYFIQKSHFEVRLYSL